MANIIHIIEETMTMTIIIAIEEIDLQEEMNMIIEEESIVNLQKGG